MLPKFKASFDGFKQMTDFLVLFIFCRPLLTRANAKSIFRYIGTNLKYQGVHFFLLSLHCFWPGSNRSNAVFLMVIMKKLVALSYSPSLYPIHLPLAVICTPDLHPGIHQVIRHLSFQLITIILFAPMLSRQPQENLLQIF